MDNQHDHTYCFGPFRLRTATRLLLRGRSPVSLTPKAFDTLAVLVRAGGRVVEKDELLRAVWPETIVEEGNLTFNVHMLRKALGEDPKEHKYILTVPGRGYQFVAGVSELQDEGSEAEGPARRPALGSRSIAVLPFRALGDGGRDDYLGLGIADALITRLGNIRQVVVRPTSAVRKYSAARQDPVDVGRALGVDAVLEGSIRRFGDRIRVTVQLVGVGNGSPLWAEKFDERFTDVFSVEDSISEQVTRALTLRMTGEEKKLLTKRYTSSPRAYKSYLKGRYHWNKRTEEGVRKGIEYFGRAIEEDPEYALAYAGLADCYSLLSLYGVASPRETFLRTKAAASRALDIDDELAEAHASLAYAHLYYDWDCRAAEREFKRAIALNPNYATAHHWYHEYLIIVGRPHEARTEIELARELDPLSPVINAALALPYFYTGRYDEGIERLKRVIDLEPGFYRTHLFLGMAYVQKGEFPDAIKEIQEAMTLSENSTRALAVLGWAYAACRDLEGVEGVLAELKQRMKQRYVSPYAFVLIYATLGANDLAFEWLEKCYEDRDEYMTRLKVGPELAGLRSDPRFHDMVRRVGLDTST